MDEHTSLDTSLPVRVFLVFPSPLFASGIQSVLKGHPDLDVVGTARDLAEALNQLEMVDADIVFGDASACTADVMGLSNLHNKHPGVKIIVTGDIPGANDFDDLTKITRAGISALLPATTDTLQLLEYIRIIARNDIVVYPSPHDNPLGLRHNIVRAKHVTLTQRELEVLRLVAEGCANKEIAIRCSVSESTVKAHLRQLLEKLQASNRAQAVAIAQDEDILDVASNKHEKVPHSFQPINSDLEDKRYGTR